MPSGLGLSGYASGYVETRSSGPGGAPALRWDLRSRLRSRIRAEYVVSRGDLAQYLLQVGVFAVTGPIVEVDPERFLPVRYHQVSKI